MDRGSVHKIRNDKIGMFRTPSLAFQPIILLSRRFQSFNTSKQIDQMLFSTQPCPLLQSVSYFMNGPCKWSFFLSKMNNIIILQLPVVRFQFESPVAQKFSFAFFFLVILTFFPSRDKSIICEDISDYEPWHHNF